MTQYLRLSSPPLPVYHDLQPFYLHSFSFNFTHLQSWQSRISTVVNSPVTRPLFPTGHSPDLEPNKMSTAVNSPTTPHLSPDLRSLDLGPSRISTAASLPDT